MESPPFTHQELLSLAAPFTHAGWAIDLAASRRDERRLVFRPRAAEGDDTTLALADEGRGRYTLLRTLRHAGGHEATLRATGSDLAALLAAIAAVPAARHLSEGAGFVITRDYVLDGARPALASGTVHLPGLALTLDVPPVRRVAGTLTLWPVGRARPALPEDLLAVLGWRWARLVRTPAGWTSRLRLRAAGDARTRLAEASLAQAAAHLARTLAEPPAQYHARLVAARWGVFFRRGIPTFTALALVAMVLLSARWEFRPSVTVLMLMYHVPTLIIAAAFLLQELPRFEIPPWPRRPRGPAWWPGAEAG